MLSLPIEIIDFKNLRILKIKGNNFENEFKFLNNIDNDFELIKK